MPRRRSRPWWPPRATGPTAGWPATCSSATCRSTRRARRPPRRSSTPTMTGPSRAWRKAHGQGRARRAVLPSAPATGATPSIPNTGFMRARKRDGTFREPVRSRAPAATAPTTPRATPGSTPGTCRRTSPGFAQAYGGGRPAAGTPRRGVRRQDRSRRCSPTWRTSPGSSAGTRTATSRATTSPTCTPRPGSRGARRRACRRSWTPSTRRARTASPATTTSGRCRRGTCSPRSASTRSRRRATSTSSAARS